MYFDPPTTIRPAYGRRYKSAEDMLADWKAGKDFKIVNGPYTSVRDIKYLKDTSSTVFLEQPSGPALREVL